MSHSSVSRKSMNFESSARRDFRFWALLAFGAAFFVSTLFVAPSTNCDNQGDCAPWLVIVARGLGGLATIIAISYLWTNPSRGCRIDPVSGDIVWWQGRTRAENEKSARIHPLAVGMIRIDRSSERSDEIHLFNMAGERQPYFDANVLPWQFEGWIADLTACFPHIVVEVRQ
jgi:hypothetical protein